MAVRDELGELLLRAFRRHASEAALELGGATYTYADLWARAKAFAEAHREAVGADGAVGILPQRALEAYVAVLGAVLMGRPYVSLNMKFPLERQAHVARESRCRVIVADEATASRRMALLQALGDDIPPPPADQTAECSDETPVYYMFTSGTTGAPKGVEVLRRNLAAYLKTIDEVIRLPIGARCSQFFELSFDVSVHDMFYTWFAGGVLCPMGAADGANMVAFARAKQIDCWYSVPSAIALAERNGWLADNVLPDLRYCLFAGEALSVGLARRWMAACPNATGFNLYGPTEGTITITGRMFQAADLQAISHASVPIGAVNPGGEVALVDAQGRVARDRGELWIGGPQVVAGYVNNPAETAKRFVERQFDGFESRRWYRTGDLVERTPDGDLVFLSRIDDQVKVRGYRIELLEVEEAVRAAAGVPEVAVVPWPLNETGAAEGLVAFVVGAPASDDEILTTCESRLPLYMAPSRVVRVERLLLNQNGKVDRKALAATHLANAPPPARPREGRGQVEANLIAGWTKLFPGRPVGPQTTFVSLGGDSLSYINTLLETERHLGSLPPDWIQTPIAELARQAAPAAAESKLARMDLPSVIRAAAIALVMLGHFGLLRFDTGAVAAMMLVSGFFFGSGVLSGSGAAPTLPRFLAPVGQLLAAYYLVFVPVAMLCNYPLGTAGFLLLGDLVDAGPRYLWYVDALVHLMLSVALLVWVARQDPLGWMLKGAAEPGHRTPTVERFVAVACVCVGGFFTFVLPHFAAGPTLTSHARPDEWWRYTFLGQMFLFGCGLLLANKDGAWRKAGLALVGVGAALSAIHGFRGEAMAMAVTALAMLFAPTLRLPRALLRPVYALADASLFIYLLHMPVSALLEHAGLPRGLRMIASVAVGVGASWGWAALLRATWLSRALAWRPMKVRSAGA